MTKNVTISVSDELAKKMNAMPEINWSEVCRQAISKYINKRSEEKGELLKGLEDFLKTKPPESKESVEKAEIERFTRRWGKPEIVDTRTQPPYVHLRKTQNLTIGDTTLTTLKIFNDVLLTITLVPNQLSEFNAEKWKHRVIWSSGKLDQIVDYFKSKGFTVGECKLSSVDVLKYVCDGNQKMARELYDRTHGLFAHDNKDLVFITFRTQKTN